MKTEIRQPVGDDDWMDYDPIIGTGTLHSIDFNENVKIISTRGIGFLADVDSVPVFRVPCVTRKVN